MDARPDDDAALMLAYANGDTDAFTTLYTRHRGTLYRFILYRVGNRDRADELFQETWSRAIASRDRYLPQAKFTTWLLQIAHNLVVDSFRRSRRYAGAAETEHVLATQAAPEREQPDHALSDFERKRRLQLAIEELPDVQRAVFVLRMERELGLGEIAVITGAGRETVKSRLRYALNHIRQRLAE